MPTDAADRANYHLTVRRQASRRFAISWSRTMPRRTPSRWCLRHPLRRAGFTRLRPLAQARPQSATSPAIFSTGHRMVCRFQLRGVIRAGNQAWYVDGSRKQGLAEADRRRVPRRRASCKAKARRSRSSVRCRAATVLSGTVKKGKHSSGITNLGTIRGLGNFGDVRVSSQALLSWSSNIRSSRTVAANFDCDRRDGTSRRG